MQKGKTMDDYIKREDAERMVAGMKSADGLSAVKALGVIPSADVAPVRHGRWIYQMDDLYPEESTMECSVCGDFIFIRGESDNYCPNCGAKMDEGELNGTNYR